MRCCVSQWNIIQAQRRYALSAGSISLHLVWISVDLGLICAQLLPQLGRGSDAEPHSGLPARLVGDHYAIDAPCPSGTAHTGATPVCIVCWIYLAAPRLNLTLRSARRDAAFGWVAVGWRSCSTESVDVRLCGMSRCLLPQRTTTGWRSAS